MSSDRDALRTAGRRFREDLGLPGQLHDELAVGYRDLNDELVFGSLWQRPGLDQGARLVATLACLAALERPAPLAAYASVAPRLGIDGDAVREVVLQAGLYIGFVAVEPSLAAVNGVLGGPSSAGAPAPGPERLEELERVGQAVMEDLHGPRSAAGYAAADAGAPAALYALAIRYGYGVLWNRPVLSRRHRFVTAISVFAVLEQSTQLAKFTASAMASELRFAEVVEVLIQIAPYGGFPRALNALGVVEAIGHGDETDATGQST